MTSDEFGERQEALEWAGAEASDANGPATAAPTREEHMSEGKMLEGWCEEPTQAPRAISFCSSIMKGVP